MSDDRRVKGRSDEEIRRHAKNSKLDYRVDRVLPVNIVRVLRSGSVQTLYGRKKLIFQIVDDEDLGTVDAKTEFSKDTVTITSKRSVEDRARLGAGRRARAWSRRHAFRRGRISTCRRNRHNINIIDHGI